MGDIERDERDLKNAATLLDGCDEDFVNPPTAEANREAAADLRRIAATYRGAVEERDKLRRLVLRDHAQGHKAHPDCPACWKFGVRPNGWRGR